MYTDGYRLIMRLLIHHCSFFQTLLISSISLQCILALIASSIFRIPPFPEPGNCQGHDMDTVVTEADILATNAVNLINILVGDNIPRTPQNLVSALTAYALWGATLGRGTRSTIAFTPEGQDILRRAQCKL
jgi:hypothetical protein